MFYELLFLYHYAGLLQTIIAIATSVSIVAVAAILAVILTILLVKRLIIIQSCNYPACACAAGVKRHQ